MVNYKVRIIQHHSLHQDGLNRPFDQGTKQFMDIKLIGRIRPLPNQSYTALVNWNAVIG